MAVRRRDAAPLKGRLELPNDLVSPDRLTAGAIELAESRVGSTAAVHQLRTYDAIKRDARGAVVTVAWWVVLHPDEARGCPMQFLPVGEVASARLAFEHQRIVDDAVATFSESARFTSVAAGLCNDQFTMAQLRQIYEVLWDVPLDPANFHRKVTGNPGFVQATDQVSQGGPGRPAQLYRAGAVVDLALPMSRVASDR